MRQILTNKSVALLLAQGLTNTFKTKTDNEVSREKICFDHIIGILHPKFRTKKKKRIHALVSYKFYFQLLQ